MERVFPTPVCEMITVNHIQLLAWNVSIHKATTPLKLHTTEGHTKYRFWPNKHIG